jgi:hypothetical protein
MRLKSWFKDDLGQKRCRCLRESKMRVENLSLLHKLKDLRGFGDRRIQRK